MTGILILWILLCHFAGIREQFPYPQSFDGKQVSCTGRVCQIEAGADFWYVYADHIQADFIDVYKRQGWFGVEKQPLTMRKVAGMAIAIIGVVIFEK